jgi:hypothetical protein
MASGKTVTTMVIVLEPPDGIEPKVQTVGRELSPGTPNTQEAPPVPVTESMLTPEGSRSSARTLTAVDGPSLWTNRE